jgi:hypothetical protein
MRVAVGRRAVCYACALLLSRIGEVFPLLCPGCGDDISNTTFIAVALTVRNILAHLGNTAYRATPCLWPTTADQRPAWSTSRYVRMAELGLIVDERGSRRSSPPIARRADVLQICCQAPSCLVGVIVNP